MALTLGNKKTAISVADQMKAETGHNYVLTGTPSEDGKKISQYTVIRFDEWMHQCGETLAPIAVHYFTGEKT